MKTKINVESPRKEGFMSNVSVNLNILRDVLDKNIDGFVSFYGLNITQDQIDHFKHHLSKTITKALICKECGFLIGHPCEENICRFCEKELNDE